MRVVELSAVARQPWKNGAGQTRELLVWPSADAWDVRLSVADIAVAAPFSVFPGVDRWIAVLTGDGIGLSIDSSKMIELRPELDSMFGFAGESTASCVLLGSPTTDFNVMVNRERRRAVITPIKDCPSMISSAEFLACFVGSAAVIRVGQAPTLAVSSAALFWREGHNASADVVSIAADAPRGWWIELFPQEVNDG